MKKATIRILSCAAILSFAAQSGYTQSGGTLKWAKEISTNGGNSGSYISSTNTGDLLIANSFLQSVTLNGGTVAEISLSGTGGRDTFLARYNSAGTLLWAKQAVSTSDIGCAPTSISSDADGNSIITGYWHGNITLGAGETNETTFTHLDTEIINHFIAKYAPNGTLLWARQVANSVGKDVAVDANGDILVTGELRNYTIFGEGEANATTLYRTGIQDMFLAKYDSDGVLLWVKKAAGSAGNRCGGETVALDSLGNALVAGYIEGEVLFGDGDAVPTTLTGAGGHDIFIAKFAPDGALLWAKRAGGTDFDAPKGIITDDSGNSIITGHIVGDVAYFGTGESNETTLAPLGNSDIFIAKYAPGGTLIWAKNAGGTGAAYGFGIAGSENGSSIITGIFKGEATFGAGEINATTLIGSEDKNSMYIAKFDSNGTLLWAAGADPSNLSTNWATDVASDRDGNGLVLGFFNAAITLGAGEPNETSLGNSTPAHGPRVFLAKFSGGNEIVAPPMSADSVIVTTLVDEDNGFLGGGSGVSLREAMHYSNSDATVEFAVNGTIRLSLGPLLFQHSLMIKGPGASLLTVSGDNKSGVFKVDEQEWNIKVSGLTIADAGTGSTGGFWNRNHRTTTIENCVLKDNEAANGAAIFHDNGTLYLYNSTLRGNYAGEAGAIDNYATFFIENTKIEDNSSRSAEAGGIRNAGTMHISSSTISGNVAGEVAGGILNKGKGTININNCTFSENVAPDNSGGAIFNAGTVNIKNSTFSGNTAAKYGGAVFNTSSAIAHVSNSTIYNNNASQQGGGLYNTENGVLTLENTIVGGNTVDMIRPQNIFGFIQSRGNNLLPGYNRGDHEPGVGDMYPLFEPKLGPLQDNGGPTFTHEPFPTSLAIDAGSCSGLNLDQRGESRSVGRGCDIGAVEVQNPSGVQTITVTTTNDEDNGFVGGGDGISLREAINYSAFGDTIRFSVEGTIRLSLGKLQISHNLHIIGPGADRLAVSGNNIQQVLQINDGHFEGTVSNLRIMEGKGGEEGAGITSITKGKWHIINCYIVDNEAADGAAIFHQNGKLYLFNSTVRGNYAGEAGAIDNYATLFIENTKILDNSCRYAEAGGIRNAGTMHISNSTISGNVAGEVAGGIFNTHGGILNINNCTFSGNVAPDNSGGAIYTIGPTNINNSTFSGNTAAKYGGAIYNGSTINIKNSTIYNNNAAMEGGGLYNYEGLVFTLKNSIIAGNTSKIGMDLQGVFTSLGHNLIGETNDTDFTPLNGDIFGSSSQPLDPMVGPLQDNGGTMLTHALLAGSPAIDAGFSPEGEYDQLGKPRPQGARSEIGALEISSPALPDIVANTDTLDYGRIEVKGFKTLPVAIINSGRADLVIDSTTFRGKQDHLWTAKEGAPLTIMPGDTHLVYARFYAASDRKKGATLQIYSNDPDSRLIEVPMVALSYGFPKIEASATELNFGDVKLDSSKTLEVVIENTAWDTLDVSSGYFTGDDKSHWEIASGQWPFSLKRNQKQKIEITFTPTALGDFYTELRLRNNDVSPLKIMLKGRSLGNPQIVVEKDSLLFGTVHITSSDTRKVEIKNTGNGDLVFSDVSLTGADSEQFVIGKSVPETIAAGKSALIDIIFSPPAEETYTAALRIKTNDEVQPELNIVLSGTGAYTGVPTIALSRDTLNFGHVEVLTRKTFTTYIINTGSGPFEVDSTILVGPDKDAWSILNDSSSRLVPGDSLKVSAQLMASTVGEKKASILIYSNVPNAPIYPVHLAAQSFGYPEVSASSQNLDFGEVETGKEKELDVMIYNRGMGELQVTDGYFEGSDGNDWAVTAGEWPFDVAPADSHKVTILFKPSSVAEMTAALRLKNNASPEEDPFKISVVGTGTEGEDIGTGISLEDASIPTAFSLSQNYPNPFNPQTRIRFGVPKTTPVKVSIYNSNGVLVRQLVNRILQPGSYTLVWNGANDSGHQVSSGLYIYRIESAAFTATRRMLFMK